MGYGLLIAGVIAWLAMNAVGVVIASGPKGWITVGVMTVAVIASNTINAIKERRAR